MTEIRLTDAEWKVMDALWRLGRGSTREVLEMVQEGTGWAYTTAKTMLDRLADKGVLDADRGGTAAVYRPRLDRDEARRSATRQLRDRAFGGDPAPLAFHLLEDEALSASGRRELARRLRELEERETAEDAEEDAEP